MRKSDALSIISHFINITIVINFTIFLIKINALDTINLSINAFGLFVSLIANIYSVIERKRIKNK